MMSQPGYQKITIQLLSNISRSKYNQTIKFSQLLEYNERNIFLQKSAQNKSWGLSSDLFFTF